ncbi:hypothetical protein BCR36DRAFT_333866 [Piromyces finnis]|uniref:Vacuolar protein sorting-associated protein 27 n=1 Tax=Piromyces finnis TaxID=1754191 RepID=A0A1Y1V0U3_9FUNG|nr:hypothetical protein BCR36DRAFT_333866 [Piromyces finnis]|eukprot:ORX44814.1 hypothetical protein BCR36DRAFT_333866 [Piromyces finnis]
MSFFSKNPFYDMLEKATSENIPGAEEDVALNLDIADIIKSKKISAIDAVNALKKKLENENPNVQLLTIKLLDCCIKNSGNHFLAKVSQKEIVDSMTSIIRSSLTIPELKKVALTYFQNWALAFRTKPDLYYLPNVYNELKREGYRFPAINQSNVSEFLIDTETAPEWSDGNVCMRCRTNFTTFTRKHHCRKCGLVFCNDCCNKRIPLPSLGITDSVRVCESCYYKVNPSYEVPNQSNPNNDVDFNDNDFYGDNDYIYNYDNNSSNNYSGTNQQQNDLISKEEDDIKRAIELSLKEAENSNNPIVSSNNNSKSKTFSIEEQPINSDDEEEQLRRAIEASLQEVRISEKPNTNSNESHIASDNPDELLTTEIENIKLFSQLMEKISTEVPIKGLQAINDTQVQALHVQISSLHPKVMKNKNYYEEKYRKFNDIHEKLIVAKRLYDQILSQRIDAARPGSAYSSSVLYQPSSSIQQPYAYNPYSVPPTVTSHESAIDPQIQPTYLGQYPTYPIPQQVPGQPQQSVPGQDISLQQQPQMIPPQQVPLQQMPPTAVQTPPTQVPSVQAVPNQSIPGQGQPTQTVPGQVLSGQTPSIQALPPQVSQTLPVQAPPAQAPVPQSLPLQTQQPIVNSQDMKTMNYGIEYAPPGAVPYVQQPYLPMQQPNVVSEAQQVPYSMAPVPAVQQAPPPEPVEEKPLIEL